MDLSYWVAFCTWIFVVRASSKRALGTRRVLCFYFHVKQNLPSKNCAVCGREMIWRKKWERNWADVKYCGEKCRRSKELAQNDDEANILSLLQKRGSSSTICPSEILRPEDKQDPQVMERVRQAARRLVHQGKIDILQGNQVVDPTAFKGPIRLRLKK